MNSDIINPATLAMSQAVAGFLTFMPKISDVRRANAEKQPEFAADVRVGELAALTLAFGVGAIMSALTRSVVPLVVGLLMTALLWFLYESVLKANTTEGSNA
jgi:hypothetical protein